MQPPDLAYNLSPLNTILPFDSLEHIQTPMIVLIRSRIALLLAVDIGNALVNGHRLKRPLLLHLLQNANRLLVVVQSDSVVAPALRFLSDVVIGVEV